MLRNLSGPCQISQITMQSTRRVGCRREHDVVSIHTPRSFARAAPTSFPLARRQPEHWSRSQCRRMSPRSAFLGDKSWWSRFLPGVKDTGENDRGGKGPISSPEAEIRAEVEGQASRAEASGPAAIGTEITKAGVIQEWHSSTCAARPLWRCNILSAEKIACC